MGLCVLWDPLPPPGADALAQALEDDPDAPGRLELGRRAAMALALRLAPEPLGAELRPREAAAQWWAFTPEATRDGLVWLGEPWAPWPPSPVLACLVGAPPARRRSAPHSARCEPALVQRACAALRTSAAADAYESAWRDTLTEAAEAGHGWLVRWRYR